MATDRVRVVATVSLAIVLLGRIVAGQGGAVRIKGAEFDPAHVCDASADWVRNIGLTSGNDKFAFAFLMHKLCSTETNAASFGLISGVKGESLVDPIGFDFKNVNGGFTAHCGAGAPRFNVTMTDGFHFIGGCSNGTMQPSPRGTGWTEVRFDPTNPGQAFPPVAAFATIQSIQLVFDEGPDTPGMNGSPEIVLDNIFINGRMVTRP